MKRGMPRTLIEQRRAAAEQHGWHAGDAAALLEALAQLTQFIAASIDADGDWDLMTWCWGHDTDARSVMATEVGQARGVLLGMAERWALPLAEMAREENMKLYALRGRAIPNGAGWRVEDAGEAAHALAVVCSFVAAAVGTGGQFGAAEEVGRCFGHARAVLDLVAELWGLPADLLAAAEVDALTDARTGTARA